MPFIKKEARRELDTKKRQPENSGELCYEEYKKMMKAWTDTPRWCTVDAVLNNVVGVHDPFQRAKILAFLVFFYREVMPYEEQKAKENGGV
jgi:hypothetical protein